MTPPDSQKRAYQSSQMLEGLLPEGAMSPRLQLQGAAVPETALLLRLKLARHAFIVKRRLISSLSMKERMSRLLDPINATESSMLKCLARKKFFW